jgi:hypothetical protein
MGGMGCFFARLAPKLAHARTGRTGGVHEPGALQAVADTVYGFFYAIGLLC